MALCCRRCEHGWEVVLYSVLGGGERGGGDEVGVAEEEATGGVPGGVVSVRAV